MTDVARGKVMTVEGPVDANDLGVTSVHEHLSLDLRSLLTPPRTARQREVARQPISIEMLGEVRRDLLVFEDNLVLKDPHLIAEELSDFAAHGGGTVVEVTPVGLEPDPAAVRDIARAAGVKAIVGCGYYIQKSHPPHVGEASREELADELLAVIESGLGDCDVRPGVIGEIGTSQPVTGDEWKVLDAACDAQRRSGLPLYVHVAPGANGRTAPDVVEHILDEGVDAARVNVCHMDGYMDLAYQRRVANYGVFLSFDTFGLEVYYDSDGFNHNCHDSQRERHLLELLHGGYGEQLVLAQDVCCKAQLRRYGGYGYGHLLAHVVPSLRHRGLDDGALKQLLVENPKRLLTIA